MQSVSSRIWTRVAVSISYDDNHYTTGTSNMYEAFKIFRVLGELLFGNFEVYIWLFFLPCTLVIFFLFVEAVKKLRVEKEKKQGYL